MNCTNTRNPAGTAHLRIETYKSGELHCRVCSFFFLDASVRWQYRSVECLRQVRSHGHHEVTKF